MTFDVLGDVDWLAVLAGALAYFALGAIWYAPPVLGRIWMEAGGTTPGGPATNGNAGARPSGPSPAIYAVPLVGAAVSATAIGMLAVATGTAGAGEGLTLGLVGAVGFAIPICLITATFETKKPRPFVWGAVNAGYHSLGLLLASVIVGAMA